MGDVIAKELDKLIYAMSLRGNLLFYHKLQAIYDKRGKVTKKEISDHKRMFIDSTAGDIEAMMDVVGDSNNEMIKKSMDAASFMAKEFRSKWNKITKDNN